MYYILKWLGLVHSFNCQDWCIPSFIINWRGKFWHLHSCNWNEECIGINMPVDMILSRHNLRDKHVDYLKICTLFIHYIIMCTCYLHHDWTIFLYFTCVFAALWSKPFWFKFVTNMEFSQKWLHKFRRVISEIVVCLQWFFWGTISMGMVPIRLGKIEIENLFH